MRNPQEFIKAIFGIIILIMVTNAIMPQLSEAFKFMNSLVALVIFLAIFWLLKEVLPRW